jgi:hypothetical protein
LYHEWKDGSLEAKVNKIFLSQPASSNGGNSTKPSGGGVVANSQPGSAKVESQSSFKEIAATP